MQMVRNFEAEEHLLLGLLNNVDIDAVFVSKNGIKVYFSQRPFLNIPKKPNETVLNIIRSKFIKFGRYFYVNPQAITSQTKERIILRSGQRLSTKFFD